MANLTLELLKTYAAYFLREVSIDIIPSLYGVTDGKAVGTYIEHRFHEYLRLQFDYIVGNSAKGIDFDGLGVDLKVTSIRQPQSSCPFRSASEKVYGLDYHLLVFVYDKLDIVHDRASQLNFVEAIFIDKTHTADYQTTKGLLDILERNGNIEDIGSFLLERNLPLDEISLLELAERIYKNPPQLGYLTISNALQWRLQYSRAITFAKEKQHVGLENLLEPKL